MIKLMANLFYREWLLLLRSPLHLIQPLLFFVVIVSLFPLAISPDPRILVQIGPGIIWIGILFALILSFAQLFAEDYHDGCLEQLVINCHPLSILVIAKVFVHSLMIGLPLILLLPLIAFAYDLSLPAILNLIASLALALPSLCLLGSLGASVILSLRNGTLLLSLILLPLYVPILIFASAAVMHAELNQSATAELALLGAILVLFMVLLPPATSYCLRTAVES